MRARTICAYPPCDRPVGRLGLCGAHAYQREVGQELRPITPRAKSDPGARCTVSACGKPRTAKGFCSAHYAKFRKYGDPLGKHRFKYEDGCSVADCERPLKSNGHCNMHHRRILRNGDPMIVQRRRGIVRNELNHKQCATCAEWLDENLFVKNRHNADGRGSVCKPCAADYQRLRNFGVSPEGFAALLQAQGGACAICRSEDPGIRDWCIDHDHSCCPTTRGQRSRSCGACVRGLLCTTCNMALGGFRDDEQRLQTAIEYLRRSRLKAIA